MADEIKVPIVAEYKDADAKEALADAKKIDDADPKLTIKTDDRQAKQSIDDFIKKTEKLDGDTATMVLAVKAGEAQAQLGEVLAEIAKLDTSDPTIDVKMDEAAALKSDLSALETQIKSINDTPIDIDTTPARTHIDDIGKSADSSKSVLANMIGNATQDLGALGGVAGSAGVAIGQMGEYMADALAEGEGLASVLGSFGAVAGPIAGIALLTAGLTAIKGLFDRNKQAAQEQTKVTKEWADAIKEAKGNLEAAGQKKLADVFTADQKASAVAYGLTLQSLTDVIQGRVSPAYDDLRDKAAQYKAVADTLQTTHRLIVPQETFQKLSDANDAYQKLKGTVDSNTQAVKDGTAEWEVDGKFMGDASTNADNTAQAQENLKTKLDDATTAINDQITALNNQITAMSDSADAQLAASDANIALMDATANTQKVLKDSKSTHDDRVEAINKERDAIIAASQAQEKATEKHAEATGVLLTATQKVDNYNAALEDNAKNSTPQAQKAAYGYLIQLNDIPEDKQTILMSLVDQGRLDEANKLIDDVSRTRQLAIQADLDTTQAEKDLQKFIRDRNMIINAQIIAKGGAGYGSGFGPSAGPSMVAPAGMTTVNINMPRGSSGVDVVRQVAGQTRRNGRRYGQQVVNFARR